MTEVLALPAMIGFPWPGLPGIIAVLAGLGLVAGGIRQLAQPRLTSRRQNTWIPVDAEVVEATQIRRPGYDSGNEQHYLRTITRVCYSYPLPGSGERHRNTENLSRGRQATPGQTLRVFVDPARPRRSTHEIAAPGTSGCLGIPLIVTGVLVVVAGVLLCLA